MEKRKYTPPQIEIVQVNASEILVIIADSETNTQWAPRHNFDEDSFDFEGYDDYGIRSFDDRTGDIWE
ncbi:MAG: hypothetical protein J5548_11535 [Prevotella sp.]|nr:hypothetical protein [Prevotella sp.]